MDSNNGRLYVSVEEARLAGATDPVEVTGSPEAVERISAAVKAARKAKRKAAKKARKGTR